MQHDEPAPFDGGAARSSSSGSGIPPSFITVKLRTSTSVEQLVSRCDHYARALNPIHVSAALVAAVRLVEGDRWLASQTRAAGDSSGSSSNQDLAGPELAAARSRIGGRLGDALDALVSTLAAQRALCSGREIGNALWALARLTALGQLRAPPPRQLVRRLLDQFADTLPGTSCASIAHAVHALAVLGISPAPEWTDQVLYSFVARATSGRHHARQGATTSSTSSSSSTTTTTTTSLWDCSPQAVSNLVWALGELQQRHVARVWVPSLVRLLRTWRPTVPQVTANVLTACAKLQLGAAHANRDARRHGVDAHTHGHGQPQQRTGSTNSSSSLHAAELAADLSWLLCSSAPLLHAALPKELSAITWAAGQLELQPDPAWAAAMWAASLQLLPTFSPGALCTIIHGVARCGLAPPPAWVAAYLTAAARAAPGFTTIELSVVLWALSAAAVQPEPRWMEGMVGAFARGVAAAAAAGGGGGGDCSLGAPANAAQWAPLARPLQHQQQHLVAAEGGGASIATTPAAAIAAVAAGGAPSTQPDLTAGGTESREDVVAAISRVVRAWAGLRYRPATPVLAQLLATAEGWAPHLRWEMEGCGFVLFVYLGILGGVCK